MIKVCILGYGGIARTHKAGYKTELEEGIRLSYEDFLNNPMRAER